MAYQLSEQHFPVAVPFHSLEEVAAQTAAIPALTATPRRISLFLSFSLHFSFEFALDKRVDQFVWSHKVTLKQRV